LFDCLFSFQKSFVKMSQHWRPRMHCCLVVFSSQINTMSHQKYLSLKTHRFSAALSLCRGDTVAAARSPSALLPPDHPNDASRSPSPGPNDLEGPRSGWSAEVDRGETGDRAAGSVLKSNGGIFDCHAVILWDTRAMQAQKARFRPSHAPRSSTPTLS
jgi:hypothetical protein